MSDIEEAADAMNKAWAAAEQVFLPYRTEASVSVPNIGELVWTRKNDGWGMYLNCSQGDFDITKTSLEVRIRAAPYVGELLANVLAAQQARLQEVRQATEVLVMFAGRRAPV